MEKINLKTIIAFSDEKDIRKFVRFPFIQNKKIISTNGVVLFITDADNIDLGECPYLIEFESPKPNVDAAISIERFSDCDIKFNVTKLEEIFKKFDRVEANATVSCEECGGVGYVEATYIDSKGTEHCVDVNCPICHGTGIVRDETKVGMMVIEPSSAIDILGCICSHKYLRIVLDFCHDQNIEELDMMVRDDNSAILVKNEMFSIVLLGMNKCNDDINVNEFNYRSELNNKEN